MEASMARALGDLVRAQVQDRLAKEWRRWMGAGVGTAEEHISRRTATRRASTKREASGPSVGCVIQQVLAMEQVPLWVV